MFGTGTALRHRLRPYRANLPALRCLALGRSPEELVIAHHAVNWLLQDGFEALLHFGA